MLKREVFHISRISGRASVLLKSWVPARPSTPAAALGGGGHFRALHLAPGEWLVVSKYLSGSALRERLECDSHERCMATIDLSQGLAVLLIAGSATREVLAKSCGLDLHPQRFTAGQCTRTRLAKLSVIIECTDSTPQFELYVGRSYSTYLLRWLSDAAAEYTDIEY
jgi:sarcosine oxidase, subunit gamma